MILFSLMSRSICATNLVSEFLRICEFICFPVALDKTEWAQLRIVFLGMLIDGENKVIAVPVDKKEKAEQMLNYFLDKKKATVKELQRLAGFLNFLTKAIVPGRTFLRRMYSKFAGAFTGDKVVVNNKMLRDYHHVRIDQEFHNDCRVWKFSC